MSTTKLPQTKKSWRPRPTVLGVVVLLLIAGGIYWLVRPSGSEISSTSYYEVRRGDFTVSVVEGGTLTAVSEISVRSDVEGTARIIFIVPEGSNVKKGDLLVELDSSQAQDQVNQQQINYEKAKFAVEQAEAQIEIMASTTNSDYSVAKLKVEMAELDLDKYMKGQRLVNLMEASNKLVQATAQLEVNSETYTNSYRLSQKGYETKMKVQSDWLTVLNNQNNLTIATNQLWMLEVFDELKTRKTFESEVEQAKQELQRVVTQNRRKMAQYFADLETQKRTLELSEQKLERDRKNLDATKILAPQDGLVVYQISENRFSSESLIEGGAIVRNRQELIKLPDLSRMKVTVKVHESHVNMVRPGQPAWVTLDSTPDMRFQGVVERVAPLPDSQSRWGNPNLKVYNTDIHLTHSLPNAKPGVSAKGEIIITNIANALSVPIQSVTSFKGKQVVYVVNGNRAEPRNVEVGMFNTKFIQITKGLAEGDRVLLAPPFDTRSKDLEGGVLDETEKADFATNAPVRAPQGPDGSGPFPSTTGPVERAPSSLAGMTAMNTGGAGANAPGGGMQGAANAGPNAPGAGRPNFNPEELLKQYDTNGDGQLDDSEREAMRAAMAARFGAGGPGGRGNREEMLKRFDTNGDGEIDDEERAAMRAQFGAGPGGRSGGEAGGGGGPGGRGQRGGADFRGEARGSDGGPRGPRADSAQ